MGRFQRCTSFLAVSYSLLIFGCAASDSDLANNSGAGSNTGKPGGNAGSGSGPSLIGPGLTFGDSKLCGNGKQDPNEACDDGNTTDKDGCSKACQVESDWTCSWGQPCTNGAVCGNKKLSSSEACDDGNTAAGDGCAADCRAVEPGWRCRNEYGCTPICGDGMLAVGSAENCDDGNKINGDGCSASCLTEAKFTCTQPAPGAPSVCTPSTCGNGVVESGEGCDLGLANGLFSGKGDGCSKSCAPEPKCRNEAGVTQACKTSCGDGNIDVNNQEACDDGNNAPGDGCDGNCQVEVGFTCNPVETPDTQPCTNAPTAKCLVLPITYRDFDSEKEATGHPDFFFLGTGSGANKRVCVPNASGRAPGSSGTCWGNDATALCLGLADATLDADGKPKVNAVRTGGLTCACRFTDWDKTGILTGITSTNISTCSSGGSGEITRINLASVPVIKSADSFKQWYSDKTPGTDQFVETLELAELPGSANMYQFSSSDGRTVYDDLHDIYLASSAGGGKAPAGAATKLSSGFFPPVMEAPTNTHPRTCNLWPYWAPPGTTLACSGQQWDARAGTPDATTGLPPGNSITKVTGMTRNFYFTSEARYLFRYSGDETLSFYGDDDVWVYVNGFLVLDMGAPHERLQGTVTLPAAAAGAAGTATANLQVQVPATGKMEKVGTPQTSMPLGLVPGNTYEIAIFHADRHPRESNYQLTLSGFNRTASDCKPTCGDAQKATSEECDLGAAIHQDGLYNGCQTDCTFGPYCGDGKVDAAGGEDCDLGSAQNISVYDNAGAGCSPTCKKPHFCGDGILDSAFDEQCDAGSNNGSGSCTRDCRYVMQ